jgi:phospholipase C
MLVRTGAARLYGWTKLIAGHTKWPLLSASPKWNETLLLITYDDEHGGTYDHVMPPWGATPPDMKSSPGQQGLGFDRFGVRDMSAPK